MEFSFRWYTIVRNVSPASIDPAPYPEWFRRSAENVPALENARTIYKRVYFLGNHPEGRKLRKPYCLPNTRVFTDNKTLSHVPPRRRIDAAAGKRAKRITTEYRERPTNRSIRTKHVLHVTHVFPSRNCFANLSFRSGAHQEFFVFFFGGGGKTTIKF